MQYPKNPPIPKIVPRPAKTDAGDPVVGDTPVDTSIPVTDAEEHPELDAYVMQVYGSGWTVKSIDPLYVRITNKSGAALKFSHGGRYS